MSNRYGLFQNYGGGELRNWRFQNLSAAPSTPGVGQPYFDTAKGGTYIWNGTANRPTDAALLTDGTIKIAGLEVDPRARSTHTGTQLANTISNFATTVQGYSLDLFAAPQATLSIGNQRITLLATAVNATDAVPLAQVQNLITNAVQGVTSIKNPVRVVTTSNVTLSGLQTFDNVTLVAGDRVLNTAQTDGKQNLIYIAQSGGWTVAQDSNDPGELIEGTQVLVAEGNLYAGSTFRVNTTGTITPGTTSVAWVRTNQPGSYSADEATLHMTGTQFSARLAYGLTTVANGIQVLPAPNAGVQVTSAGIGLMIPASASGLLLDSTGVHVDFTSTIAVARCAFGTITGDGSTTQFTITHNLGTRRIWPTFQDSSYAGTDIDWVANTVNAVTVNFGNAPPANGVTLAVTIFGAQA